MSKIESFIVIKINKLLSVHNWTSKQYFSNKISLGGTGVSLSNF